LTEQENKLITLTIVGAGNLGWHLGHVFTNHGVKVDKIINRSTEPARHLALEIGSQFTNDFGASNSDSDFTILAVNDSFLPETLNKINIADTIVLHTSGSTDIDIFSGKVDNNGILYPFQSFTKNVAIDFSQIPVCVEASDEITLKSIFRLASTISSKVYVLSSEKRRILHLAGVIANNFTNHLIARTFDFLEKNDIDNQIVLPLIEETFNKIKLIGPREAQTGPARRKNMDTIEKHLKILEKEPELKNLYNVISESIIAYYSS
jgi:predicted short-subunit dehydrogenase-like oxidoreductase (DUF2520 family)